MINNTTTSKADYIKLWFSHIDSLNILCFTNDAPAREQIEKSIIDLKKAVLLVANSLGLRDSKTAQAYYTAEEKNRLLVAKTKAYYEEVSLIWRC